MDEPAFLAVLRRLPLHPGARGLVDDAAVLDLGGETLVLTHDVMAEGVHFLPEQDMADVAWKLVAVNLSDLAAKGAEPLGVLLGYQLGRDDARFLHGLREALDTFGVPLLGGDTVGSRGPRTFGLTAIGRATHAPVPSRGGARPGDRVYLTGTVGAAMLGFEALQDGTGVPSDAYRRPRPRLAQGRALAPLVSAMMDVSDGLLLDCWRMAEASEVAIHLNGSAIPVASEQRRDACLRWGDDYELLFALPPHTELPVPACLIGHVASGPSGLSLDGQALSPSQKLGFQHASVAEGR